MTLICIEHLEEELDAIAHALEKLREEKMKGHPDKKVCMDLTHALLSLKAVQYYLHRTNDGFKWP